MKKRIWILTIFPEYFKPLLECGLSSQVFQTERTKVDFKINLVNVREFGKGNYKSVDDYPYGGGPGMIMRSDVLWNAFSEGVLKAGGYCEDYKKELHTIYTGARGEVWNNENAQKMSSDFWDPTLSQKDLVFLCGRYEGVDQRFLDCVADQEISIGDFILTGGEVAVMTILDSAIRFIPGGLGNDKSVGSDSFEDGLLDYPQYTRPADFKELKVPDVLISGHHKNIEKWQSEQKIEQTKKFRPDLWKKYKKENNESKK